MPRKGTGKGTKRAGAKKTEAEPQQGGGDYTRTGNSLSGPRGDLPSKIWTTIRGVLNTLLGAPWPQEGSSQAEPTMESTVPAEALTKQLDEAATTTALTVDCSRRRFGCSFAPPPPPGFIEDVLSSMESPLMSPSMLQVEQCEHDKI
jgi:hypothetical protein